MFSGRGSKYLRPENIFLNVRDEMNILRFIAIHPSIGVLVLDLEENLPRAKNSKDRPKFELLFNLGFYATRTQMSHEMI